jgi:hypothetical protein
MFAAANSSSSLTPSHRVSSVGDLYCVLTGNCAEYESQIDGLQSARSASVRLTHWRSAAARSAVRLHRLVGQRHRQSLLYRSRDLD